MTKNSGAWRDEMLPWVRSIFAELRHQVRINHPATAKSDEFLTAFGSARREAIELYRHMSDHTDGVDTILRDVGWLLRHANSTETVAKAAPGILNRIENHLNRVRPESSEQWPDGPGTTEGVCWVCGNEGNIRHLADPLDSEPRDREQWCIKCYRIRRKKL